MTDIQIQNINEYVSYQHNELIKSKLSTAPRASSEEMQKAKASHVSNIL